MLRTRTGAVVSPRSVMPTTKNAAERARSGPPEGCRTSVVTVTPTGDMSCSSGGGGRGAAGLRGRRALVGRRLELVELVDRGGGLLGAAVVFAELIGPDERASLDGGLDDLDVGIDGGPLAA